jgi:sRNA-binding protein
MNYRYSRQEIESAIELLADSYPSCFFLDPEKRRPLKHNITVDLSKDGVRRSYCKRQLVGMKVTLAISLRCRPV